MGNVVVLFNRDLRVHDHPALTAAARAGRVVPLFVLDEKIFSADPSANRTAFLLASLRDLDRSLKQAGAGLVVRWGDCVDEALAVAAEVGASALFASEDSSAFARARQRRLGIR
ncbi:MAG: deoxyribodipyrimidine photo-lyase [Actinomycetota bacterium]